jgi:hypothetical protein
MNRKQKNKIIEFWLRHLMDSTPLHCHEVNWRLLSKFMEEIAYENVNLL